MATEPSKETRRLIVGISGASRRDLRHSSPGKVTGQACRDTSHHEQVGRNDACLRDRTTSRKM